VLSKLHPSDAAKLDAMLKEYLAQIPDGQANPTGSRWAFAWRTAC